MLLKRPAAAMIDQYHLPAGPTAANLQHQHAAGEWEGQTDRETDERTPNKQKLHSPCSAYYVGSTHTLWTANVCHLPKSTVCWLKSANVPLTSCCYVKPGTTLIRSPSGVYVLRVSASSNVLDRGHVKPRHYSLSITAVSLLSLLLVSGWCPQHRRETVDL